MLLLLEALSPDVFASFRMEEKRSRGRLTNDIMDGYVKWGS
jgi:hypothetical protein